MDFDVSDHGSIVLLTPRTDAARSWATENLPDDAQMMGNAYAIEPRYVDDILEGFANS